MRNFVGEHFLCSSNQSFFFLDFVGRSENFFLDKMTELSSIKKSKFLTKTGKNSETERSAQNGFLSLRVKIFFGSIFVLPTEAENAQTWQLQLNSG